MAQTKSRKTGHRSLRSKGRDADAAAKSPTLGVRIRMYRIGVGDCFLVSLDRKDKTPFRMLIDCGVHQSQKGGSDRIREVVADLKSETQGKLDVVVVTHEHADHISGFRLAMEDFKTFDVGEVWFAWTEDDNDALARDLAGSRRRALTALTNAHARMRLMGLEGADNKLEGLLGFFGGGGGKKSIEAGKIIKGLSNTVRYWKPGAAPIEFDGANARAFVLGPPRSPDLIKKDAPSRSNSEVYQFGAYSDALAAIEPALGGEVSPPFDDALALSLEGTASLKFFQGHYWSASSVTNSDDPREDVTQEWRRIDHDWLDATTALALKLDEDTNNTSLVLAIELGEPESNGPVLLFAADAQVGNWLSWQDVKWNNYCGREITGPDLLRRTLVYKVGHHASHNATLRELGLELMDSLELALVPTDDKMAKKVGWGTLPWPPLLERLAEKTKNRVVRTDRELPEGIKSALVTDEELFYEIAL